MRNLGGVLPLIVLAISCSFDLTREEADEYFGQVSHRSFEKDIGDRTIFWVEAGLDDRAVPMVLFIHGSPGGWSAYKEYLKSDTLRQRARLVSVDRPGYGGSVPHVAVPDLSEQSRLIAAVFADHTGPVILVGHSLGGPIACQIAMQKGDRIQGVVVVAGSIDPELEDLRWFNFAADMALVRWTLPVAWNVSNDEIMPLEVELLRMRPTWSSITAGLSFVHGEEDELVPVENIEFARQRVPDRIVSIARIPDAGHFILWEEPHHVEDAILEFLHQL